MRGGEPPREDEEWRESESIAYFTAWVTATTFLMEIKEFYVCGYCLKECYLWVLHPQLDVCMWNSVYSYIHNFIVFRILLCVLIPYCLTAYYIIHIIILMYVTVCMWYIIYINYISCIRLYCITIKYNACIYIQQYACILKCVALNINLHARIIKYTYTYMFVHQSLYYSMYASIQYVKCTYSYVAMKEYTILNSL